MILKPLKIKWLPKNIDKMTETTRFSKLMKEVQDDKGKLT